MRITPQIFSLGTKNSFVIFYKFLCDRLMAHVSIFCFDDNKIDVGFFFQSQETVTMASTSHLNASLVLAFIYLFVKNEPKNL